MSSFARSRPIWSVVAAVYMFIAGGLSILSGFASIFLIAPLADAAGFFGGLSFIDPSLGFIEAIITNIFLIGILLGVISIVMGVLRIIAGIALNRLRPWGRILGIILFALGALSWLGLMITLISLGAAFQSIIPFLIFAAEITLAIGLVLPGTAQAFQPFSGAAFGGGVADRQTQIAPQFPAPVYSPPPPLPPTQGVPAIPTPVVSPPAANFPATEAATAANVGGGGNYGRPGGVGVQKTEFAQAEPQILAWLIERNGPRAGREHRLREQVTIGRDPARCEIVLDDSKVSGEHARIRLEKGQYVLYDLASTNHTFVNGQEVQKHVLHDGDQIRFGTNATTSFLLAGK